MYIISAKKDYYDSASSEYGIDKSVIYTRERKNIDPTNNRMLREYFYDITPYSYSAYERSDKEYLDWARPFIVGFCGKLYVGYVMSFCKGIDEVRKTITYDREEIEKYIKIDYKQKKWKYSMSSRYFTFRDIYDDKEDDSLFIKYDVPVFVMDYGTTLSGEGTHQLLILNPMLKDYEFYRVFGSVQAHQEVSMYVGNVLTKPDEPLQVSDKYRIMQHGFDKNSFRQVSPGNKKENRAANKLKKKEL